MLDADRGQASAARTRARRGCAAGFAALLGLTWA
jgi:hypothetical protein